MKISIYTMVRNGIYFDLHVEAMLRHHLGLADEIVVNEGFSSDGTYERITSIDPKIRVFREEWKVGDQSGRMYADCKNHARTRCQGEWCVLLDCDEFIPEWEFERLRAHLAGTQESVISLRYVQFYGNYRVHNSKPETWFAVKQSVHRNLESMSVVGDGSNVVCAGTSLRPPDASATFECHHMGHVRHPARLRQKWRIEHKLKLDSPKWDRTPGLAYDIAPHDWFDPQFLRDLRIYEGPHCEAVRNDPREFTRDDMRLYEYLRARSGA